MDREDAQGIDTLSAEEAKYFEEGGEGETDAGTTTDQPAGTTTDTGDTGADAGQTTTTDTQAGKTTEQPKKPSGKMVALESLHESRAREKELRDQLTEERKQRTVIEQRTNTLLEAWNRQNAAATQPQPKAEEAPALPPIEEDPVRHILGRLDAFEKRVGDTTKTVETAKATDQQAQVIRNIQTTSIAMEAEFKKATPDYDAAVEHLKRTQDGELEAMGYSTVERQNMIVAQALGAAARALQQGRNPAEVLYAMAKVRGYAPKPPANQAGDTNAAAVEAAKRLAQVDRGQKEGQSLSRARGTAPVPLTAQRLLEMPDSEFARLTETDEGRALMGA